MNLISNGKINILTIGRFHVFEYARIFEKLGILNKIISGYPKFKLRDEPEIPDSKVIGTSTHSFYMFCVRFKFLSNLILKIIDLSSVLFFQISSIPFIIFYRCEYLLILSKSGLLAAILQKFILRGKVIVEHTSTHPKNYNIVVKTESKFYKIKPQLIDRFSLLIHELEFKIADKIIVPTNYVKDTFKKYKHKLEVIPIPSNKRFKRFLESSKIRKYKKNYKYYRSINILSISQITPRKGIRYLFESLNFLSRKLDVNLTLIGRSSFKMNEYISKYEKKFNLNYIEALSQKQLINHYLKSDIFLLLSAEEGLPSVFKESILCGVPIIGSLESGARDLEIENKVFCIDKTDQEKIHETINQILTNDELNNNFGKKFIKKYDDDILLKWIKIINDLNK
tara:strand:- start:24648 stop:25835 length:1188 start_codon:yes stop_codon:yes gene_type:complete